MNEDAIQNKLVKNMRDNFIRDRDSSFSRLEDEIERRAAIASTRALLKRSDALQTHVVPRRLKTVSNG